MKNIKTDLIKSIKSVFLYNNVQQFLVCLKFKLLQDLDFELYELNEAYFLQD